MTNRLTRVLAASAALASTAALLPGASTAFAAPLPAGAAPAGQITLSPTSGDSDTDITLSLPTVPATCPGDAANQGYRWNSIIAPAGTDLATVVFTGGNPSPAGRSLLAAVGNSPVRNGLPSLGDAIIADIPAVDFKAFTPSVFPAGEYVIGIVCTKDSLPEKYWSVPITITTAPVGTGGPAQFTWAYGARPAAPTSVTATGGDGSASVGFAHATSVPATSGYTVTATPQGGGAAVTATGTASPITVPGLTNGTTYDVTVTATNSVGTSVASAPAATVTPAPAIRPAVASLTATPAIGSATISWTAPASGPAPIGYTVTITPAVAGSPFTVSASTLSQAVTGLAAGTAYTATVTPTHASPYVAQATTTAPFTVFADTVIQQEIDVTRPVGALVLTQRCGVYGALPAEGASTGFPGGLSAMAASGTTGTAPMYGSVQDPNFGQYPYPTDSNGVPNANYPTVCGIDLGAAKLVTSGAGAGQFFAASGRLNQVTVVDTRDTDTGWTVNGVVSSFTAGANTFSGNHLGWSPVVTSDSAAFDDDLNSATPDYDQTVTKGADVAPRTTPGIGSSSGQTLASAPAGSGLGIAELDARLKLLIPVTANNGNYNATLSFTVV